MECPWRALCALVVAAAVECASAEAVALFQSTEMTLDTLTAGDTAQVTFGFANATTDTIVLDQAKAECGCVVRAEIGRRYAPGDSGMVAVVVHTGGGQWGGGSRRIALTFLASGDTTRERATTVVLTVTAPVRRDVQFMPELLAGLLTDRRRPAMVGGALANQTDRPIRIESLAIDTPSVLEVLTRHLPCVLGPKEQLPFAVCIRDGCVTDGVSAVRSRIRARTHGTRYAEHSCEVYIYLE